MIALLIWLAGCAFFLWRMWHGNLLLVAWDMVQVFVTFLWIVGGASWIGRKLGNAGAARMAAKPRDPYLEGLNKESKTP